MKEINSICVCVRRGEKREETRGGEKRGEREGGRLCFECVFVVRECVCVLCV